MLTGGSGGQYLVPGLLLSALVATRRCFRDNGRDPEGAFAASPRQRCASGRAGGVRPARPIRLRSRAEGTCETDRGHLTAALRDQDPAWRLHHRRVGRGQRRRGRHFDGAVPHTAVESDLAGRTPIERTWRLCVRSACPSSLRRDAFSRDVAAPAPSRWSCGRACSNLSMRPCSCSTLACNC